MSDERIVEHETITVEDNAGNRYDFEVKVTKGYSYTDKKKTLCIWVHHDTMPISAITFLRDEKTGDHYCPVGSGWDFVLEYRVPLHQGIGTRLWRKIEGLFYKYHVVSLNGIIGQPPGMSEALGYGIPESSRKKNEIAKLFWAKMGFTVTENREIHKTYERRRS